MAGAADKAEIRMRDVWFSGMLGRLDKPPTLDEFTGKSSRGGLAQCLAQWDKIDAALARNKPS